jgi:uroporphyrin-III C-methyltransferase/precorrin-2 dehydrogenase/sirohydrochlorin ferrochelatase
MHSLPVFVRLRDRPVMLLGEGEAVAAKRRLLERAGARIVGRDETAALAVLGPDVAEAEAAALRNRGVLVNAVDRPALCDWTLPAVVERGPVLVAVGTGGVSAGLAAAIRQRLERLLPETTGRVAEALHAARGALRARFPDGGERRRAIGALLAEGGPLDPLADQPDAAARLEDALAGVAVPAGRLERIMVRSPDPDELTLRAARLLSQADRLFHPPDMARALLDRARADAERVAGAPPVALPPGLSVLVEWEA